MQSKGSSQIAGSSACCSCTERALRNIQGLYEYRQTQLTRKRLVEALNSNSFEWMQTARLVNSQTNQKHPQNAFEYPRHPTRTKTNLSASAGWGKAQLVFGVLLRRGHGNLGRVPQARKCACGFLKRQFESLHPGSDENNLR